MKIKAIQLRKGNIILFNNDLYVLTDVMHITPGKGQAVIQTKMKNIKTGNNAEKRFRPDESVEKADLETRKMEFLYEDGPDYYFMDQKTYDQIPINAELLGDGIYYLLPNIVVDVSFYENAPIGVELPFTVELKVVETEPTLKTATVTSSYKPAVLETGLKIQVPPFIEEGEVIRVDTRDGKYLERAK
ncbi:MAG TPA: elongation factor P [Calditrichaeota bacterium]|nr:elongation factor P [Calditrichota bacterium]